MPCLSSSPERESNSKTPNRKNGAFTKGMATRLREALRRDGASVTWTSIRETTAPGLRSTYYSDAPVGGAVYSTVDPASRSGQPVPQNSQAPEPIFYPRNGQTAETTEHDRRECNRWATTQRGAMSDASIFQRATLACMEGRGYTVK